MEDRQNVFLIQSPQHKDAGARQQGSYHFKAWVFSGGSDEGNHTMFNMGKHCILLRFVKPMNLVDKQNRALPRKLLKLLRILNDFSQISNASRNSAQADKMRVRVSGNDFSEGCLATPWRSPENH